MSRTAKLAEALRDEGIDAFFAWSPIAIGYLRGFWEHPHRRFALLAVHSDGRDALIVPALGRTTAEEAGIEDVRPWTDDEDPLALFAELGQEWDLKSGILAVDDEMPSRMLLAMQGVLPAALFRSGGGTLAKLMRRKEPFEIALLEDSARIVDEVFLAIKPELTPGQTEIEIADRLRTMMRERGAEPTFAIVAGGPNSAKPHHAPTSRPIEPGEPLLLDFGGTYRRYGSDITRMVTLGETTQIVRETYAAVWAAHETARLDIRPGTTGAQADGFARGDLDAMGLAGLFVHRLGHGIGLAEHEEPFLVGTNDRALEVGDAFTLEPGVYRPGEFGVRLENTYVLEAEGPRSLNAAIAPEIEEL